LPPPVALAAYTGPVSPAGSAAAFQCRPFQCSAIGRDDPFWV
jgi:hypothetical protein